MNDDDDNNWDRFESTPNLLIPPTAFESSVNNDASATSARSMDPGGGVRGQYDNHSIGFFIDELKKLKTEIGILHRENEQLRHRNKDFVKHARLYSDVTDHRNISITALEDHVRQQTIEIQSLKTELFEQKEREQKHVRDLESKHAAKLEQMTSRLNEVESQKQLSEALSQQRLDSFNQNMKRLEEEKTEMNKEIERLRGEIVLVRQDKEKAVDDYENKLSTQREENNKQLNELTKLRHYVNDSLPTMQTVKEMIAEREKFEEQILKVKERNEALLKENGLLQVRLKSINEILTLQEAQLESSSKSNSSHSTANMFGNDRKRQGLLQKWRNKVFELLVELKSNEITYKQRHHMDQKTIEECMSQLAEQTNRSQILENVIDDNKAEITVLTSKNARLSDQLELMKEENERLIQKCKQDHEVSIKLKNALMSLYPNIEESFKQINKKLNHADQRIQFAINRLNVMKPVLKESRRKDELKDLSANISSIHASNAEESNINVDDLELYRSELKKAHEERDMLAERLSNQRESKNVEIANLTSEKDRIIQNLKSEVQELKSTCEAKQKELNMVKDELAIKEKMYEELNAKYQEQNQNRKDVDAESQSKINEIKLDYENKMAQLDVKLNEARREQAKAFLLMRNMEKSTSREKERMEEMVKSRDEYYQSQIKSLQSKMIALEKDRNNLFNLNKQNQIVSSQYSPSAIFKAPSDYFDKSLLKQIDWLEKSKKQDQSTTLSNPDESNVNIESKMSAANDATSIWLNSKNSMEEMNQEAAEPTQLSQIYPLYYYNQSEHENDNQSARTDVDRSVDKHQDILLQIKTILNNLNESDEDDNPEQDHQ